MKKKIITDWEGKKEIIEFDNGLIRTSIIEPSAEYIDTVLTPLKEKFTLMEEARRIDTLIKREEMNILKKMATDSLKEKGLL